MRTLRPLLRRMVSNSSGLNGPAFAQFRLRPKGTAPARGLLGLRLGVVSRLVNATINNVQDDRAVPTQYARRSLAAWIGLVPTGSKDRLGSSPSRAIDTCGGCWWSGQWPSSATRASTERRSGPGAAIDGAPTHQSGDRCARQQCADGLGHHGPRREIQGAETVAGGMSTPTDIDNTNWRGHDDVMQLRLFRRTRLGHRTYSNVREFLFGTRSAHASFATRRGERETWA